MKTDFVKISDLRKSVSTDQQKLAKLEFQWVKAGKMTPEKREAFKAASAKLDEAWWALSKVADFALKYDTENS
jgi:hypothetical protein